MSQSKYKQRLVNAHSKIAGAQKIIEKNQAASTLAIANDALGNACMLITDSLVEVALRAAGNTDQQIAVFLESQQNTSMVKLNVVGKIFKMNSSTFERFDELAELLEARRLSTHEVFVEIEQAIASKRLRLMKSYYSAAHKIAYRPSSQ